MTIETSTEWWNNWTDPRNYLDGCPACKSNFDEEVQASLSVFEQQSDTEFTQRQAEVMEELDGIPVQ